MAIELERSRGGVRILLEHPDDSASHILAGLVANCKQAWRKASEQDINEVKASGSRKPRRLGTRDEHHLSTEYLLPGLPEVGRRSFAQSVIFGICGYNASS
jgi:hypothetical protein